MSFEQAVFKGFKTLYAEDSALVGLLAPGGFVHADELARQRTTPRIEFSMSAQTAEDSQDRIDNSIVRLGVFVRRDLAFGGGAAPETGGQLESIIDRVESVFNGKKISASGWSFTTLGLARVIPGPSSHEVVHRVVEFLVDGVKS